eukprot:GILK01004919.1.p1 GENE.GILK01004919.1~~GILK01004919.1.p1  ORF type:complete len:345 (-),score=38.73 GILK01004919.1:131-1060(-)
MATDVAVTAVAARDVKAAERYAKKHNIPRVLPSYDALIEDQNIDAIYIALPNSHHHKWTLRSLEHGKHVLCEKPLASNAADASEMSQKAQQTGLVLFEAFHYRHHPYIARVKELLAELGNVTSVDTKFCIPVFRGTDIRYNFSLAGGAMMDVGCYAVNCLRLLLGEEPTEVTSASTTLAYENVDQETIAEFKTATGKTGRIHVSLFTIIPRIAAHIQFDNGASLHLYNWLAPHILWNRISYTTASGVTKSERIQSSDSTYTHQLRAFVAAVRDHVPVETDHLDGVKNMTVIDAVYDKLGLPRRSSASSA